MFSTFDTCIPLTLQDLMKNYSPSHVSYLKRSQLMVMRKKAIFFLIIGKELLKSWNHWKRLISRRKIPRNTCILKNSESMTVFKAPAQRKSIINPTRKKTVQKLESSIKFSRSIRKIQKNLLKFSFKYLVFHSKLKKIKVLMISILSRSFQAVLYRIQRSGKQELSIISATPVSITPVPRSSSKLSLTQENCLNLKANPSVSPGLISKRYSNEDIDVFDCEVIPGLINETFKFDLPNLSLYDSLNVSSHRHGQLDSLDISSSFIGGGLGDESLVELEGENFDEEVSPTSLVHSKDICPNLPCKSSSTAIIKTRTKCVDRYNVLDSKDTINEVSISRSSLKTGVIESWEKRKKEKFWVKTQKNSTINGKSHIFKSSQGYCFARIVQKKRQFSFAQGEGTNN
jgi:hypothetical protein